MNAQIGSRALGPIPSGITLTADNCQNTTLAAGAACSVTASFTPSASTTYSSTWTWRTVDQNGAVTYTVQGTGHASTPPSFK